MNTDHLFTTLDLPKINRMQVGFFCEPFLTPANPLAMFADIFADDSLIGQPFSHPYSQQEGGKLRHIAQPSILFSVLPFAIESSRNASRLWQRILPLFQSGFTLVQTASFTKDSLARNTLFNSDSDGDS